MPDLRPGDSGCCVTTCASPRVLGSRLLHSQDAPQSSTALCRRHGRLREMQMESQVVAFLLNFHPLCVKFLACSNTLWHWRSCLPNFHNQNQWLKESHSLQLYYTFHLLPSINTSSSWTKYTWSHHLLLINLVNVSSIFSKNLQFLGVSSHVSWNIPMDFLRNPWDSTSESKPCCATTAQWP